MTVEEEVIEHWWVSNERYSGEVVTRDGKISFMAPLARKWIGREFDDLTHVMNRNRLLEVKKLA